jgi:hypothetical protein
MYIHYVYSTRAIYILDIQGLQSPASRTGLSLHPHLGHRAKGYSRPPVGLGSLHPWTSAPGHTPLAQIITNYYLHNRVFLQ